MVDSPDEPISWWTAGGQLKSSSKTGKLTHNGKHFAPSLDKLRDDG